MARPVHFAAPNEPLQIYQDEFQDENYEQSAPSISRAPMPSVGKQPSPRRALQNSTGNTVFNPPNGHRKHHSPYKGVGQSSAAPLGQSQGRKLNTINICPPVLNAQATDSMPKKPLMSTFKTANSRQVGVDKENLHPTLYPAPPALNLNVEEYYPTPTGKRALLEAAPIAESRPSKKAKLDLDPTFILPPDDGNKPGFSYAQLIGIAILSSPHQRLTLNHIYKWIAATFSFYSLRETGWQNSIRHNLSLNKAFIKQGRPKDDPGKGSYWVIKQGMETQFLKDKPSRKASLVSENVHVMSMVPRVDYSQVDMPYLQDGLPSLPTIPQAQTDPYLQAMSHIQVTTAPEPSSDATIPLSDNVCAEDLGDKVQEPVGPGSASLPSPLPAVILSSPPMPRYVNLENNTPPSTNAVPHGPRKRSQRRKHASTDASAKVDDSGYLSSLESSVLRQPNPFYSSETKHPRMKGGRGRAEDEIRRLRHSSYDSPTKSRSHGPMPASSPSRQSKQMPPPITPVVKIERPTSASSASPNTNLRIHRHNVKYMFHSPNVRANHISNNLANLPTWDASSYGDSIDDGLTYELDCYTGFGGNDDSFFNNVAFDLMTPLDVSPVKRSVRRPRMDQSQSAGVLGDITNSPVQKSVTSAPFLGFPSPAPAYDYESPSKAFDMSSPSKDFLQLPVDVHKPNIELPANGNDWIYENNFAPPLFEGETENLLDLSQGFEKINGNGSVVASWKGYKPSLDDNYTIQ